MKKVDKIEDVKCTRFMIDDIEYLRVGGVWFQYTTEQYIPIDKPEFEKYYKEFFEK